MSFVLAETVWLFESASLNIDDSQSYVCFENYRPLNDFLLLKTYHDI